MGASLRKPMQSPLPRKTVPPLRLPRPIGPGSTQCPSQWQGLTLVDVRAQLEQLQDTFMSSVGLYGGQNSSS